MSTSIVPIIAATVHMNKGSVYIHANVGRTKYRFKKAYTSIEQACFKLSLMLTRGTIDLDNWSKITK